MTGLSPAHRPLDPARAHRHRGHRAGARAGCSAATVGVGTVAYALAIGPLAQFFIPLFAVPEGTAPDSDRAAAGRPRAGHPGRLSPHRPSANRYAAVVPCTGWRVGVPFRDARRHHLCMGENGWRWTDAWIFVSLVIAQRRRTAPPVGDEPAAGGRPPRPTCSPPPTTSTTRFRERHEVEAAVRRLVGAGLVSVADGWFRITADGEQLWRTRPRAGVATMVDTVQGVLTRRHAPGSADWHPGRGRPRARPSRNTRSGRFRPPRPADRSPERPHPACGQRRGREPDRPG